MQTVIPWQKIEALENEIRALKSLGNIKSKKDIKKAKSESLYGILKTKPSSIEGILKGVHTTWADFKDAKKIWFNEKHLLNLTHKK